MRTAISTARRNGVKGGAQGPDPAQPGDATAIKAGFEKSFSRRDGAAGSYDIAYMPLLRLRICWVGCLRCWLIKRSQIPAARRQDLSKYARHFGLRAPILCRLHPLRTTPLAWTSYSCRWGLWRYRTIIHSLDITQYVCLLLSRQAPDYLCHCSFPIIGAGRISFCTAIARR
jgi:hypothetical protein